MVAELRWILLGGSVLLLAGIWWWGARRSRRTPADATLRESTLEREEMAGETLPYRAAEPPPDWGVSPFEPLSIRTADFDRVEDVDLPMRATPAPLDVSLNLEPEPEVTAARVEAPAPAEPGALPGDAPEPREAQRIVTVRVSAIDDSRWAGADLKAALEQHAMSFGRYKVFHRMHGDGRTLFCAASLVEPGTFDVARMANELYRGVTLFAVLPGPADALQTIDALIVTAGDLAATLQGQVQDAQGAPMTLERADALRDEVARFQALPPCPDEGFVRARDGGACGAAARAAGPLQSSLPRAR